MFLMSKDLTRILNEQNRNEHNEGFFLSKHYAKFFVALGQICLTLPDSKKLTFLSSLSAFAETNIEKIT